MLKLLKKLLIKLTIGVLWTIGTSIFSKISGMKAQEQKQNEEIIHAKEVQDNIDSQPVSSDAELLDGMYNNEL